MLQKQRFAYPISLHNGELWTIGPYVLPDSFENRSVAPLEQAKFLFNRGIPVVVVSCALAPDGRLGHERSAVAQHSTNKPLSTRIET